MPRWLRLVAWSAASISYTTDFGYAWNYDAVNGVWRIDGSFKTLAANLGSLVGMQGVAIWPTARIADRWRFMSRLELDLLGHSCRKEKSMKKLFLVVGVFSFNLLFPIAAHATFYVQSLPTMVAWPTPTGGQHFYIQGSGQEWIYAASPTPGYNLISTGSGTPTPTPTLFPKASSSWEWKRQLPVFSWAAERPRPL